MTKTETHPGNLKLIGGWLCLDFVNTVDWHTSDHPHEWLNSYSDLISWSQHANILTDNEGRDLLQKAELRPTDAKTILERAILLREALFRIFSAIANHSVQRPPDIAILNKELSTAMTRMRLTPTADCSSWVYASEGNALDQPLWSVARSVLDLLTSNKLNRIRRCSADDCGWLFLDMSRNRSRKWCDMKDCGNRAKARRHHRREHERAHNSSSK